MDRYYILLSHFTTLILFYFFYKTRKHFFQYTTSINKILNLLYENYYELIEFMNEHLLIDYYEETDNNINTKDENNENNNKNVTVSIIKYEDKYLDKIQKIKNEYDFTQYEKELENTKFLEFLTMVKNEDQDKNENKENNNNNLIFFSEEESREKAKNYVINQKLDKLMNSFVLDNTPLGNVIMTYNNSKEVFEYYSDNSIPYRFLETVSRKYVTTYFCRPLYVDMEEELKESEKKQLEKEEEEKLRLEKEKEEELNNKAFVPVKKSVFAKFKSYNKEGLSGGKISAGAAPPKNSIPNTNRNINNETKFLLKEKTNRYNYQGKIANFSMIKKINKKDVNKKYAMTFAEFKKKMISS